jgi:hypothetical protein
MALGGVRRGKGRAALKNNACAVGGAGEGNNNSTAVASRRIAVVKNS